MYNDLCHAVAMNVSGSLLAKKPGISITTRPNTVLSSLTAIVGTTFSSQDISGYDGVADEYLPWGATTPVSAGPSGAVDPQLGLDIFDVNFDKLVDDIYPCVIQHINVAKNTVNPIVNEFEEKITGILAAKPISAESEFNIVQIDIPEVIKNDLLRVGLEEAKQRSSGYPEKPIQSSDLEKNPFDEAYIRSLLVTGDSEIDTALITLYDSLDSLLKRQISANFTGAAVEGNWVGSFEFQDIVVGTISFVVCRRLIDADPVMTGLALAPYKTLIAEWRDFYARKALGSIEVIENGIKTDKLFNYIDKNTKTAYVLAPVYKNWLTRGGTPEVIYGAIVSKKRYERPSNLDADKTELIAEFNRYIAYFNSTANINYLKNVRTSISAAFYNLYSQLTDIETQYYTTNNGMKDIVSKNFDAYMLDLDYKELECPGSIALKAIAGIRFFFTPAFMLIDNIDNVYKENKDISIDEATLLSSLDYIVDFLADQITIRYGVTNS